MARLSKKRKYFDRFEILKDFNPHEDISEIPPFDVHDWSWSAKANKQKMIENVEAYFAFREEDEIFIS